MKRNMHLNSLKNLKPAKKGEIRNPHGRNIGSFSLVTMIKNKLQERKSQEDEFTYADSLVRKIIDKAIDDGDVTLMRDIINRVDGLPRESMDITTGGRKMTPDIDALVTKIYGAKRLGRTDTNSA